MDAKLEEIVEQQKASWNKFGPGWKKWDRPLMAFMQPVADEIIKHLHPQKDDIALDVATGTGEPGLTIASLAKNGNVTGTDIADNMLSTAREAAMHRGITNYKTAVCDVSEMPFEDATFDIISCRFGFMFFADMLLAAKEIARVLKPGGRIAVAVWDVPEKNFWVTAMGSTINKNMQLPPPLPEAPGMFRCAKPGLMAGLFEAAGFKNIKETTVAGKLSVGTAETYWQMMTEVAAPFAGALSKATDDMKATIKKDVFDLLQQKYPDGNILIDAGTLVIYGEK